MLKAASSPGRRRHVGEQQIRRYEGENEELVGIRSILRLPPPRRALNDSA